MMTKTCILRNNFINLMNVAGEIQKADHMAGGSMPAYKAIRLAKNTISHPTTRPSQQEIQND